MVEDSHRSIILECLSFLSFLQSFPSISCGYCQCFYGDRSRVFLLRFLSDSHSEEVVTIDVLMMIIRLVDVLIMIIRLVLNQLQLGLVQMGYFLPNFLEVEA